MDAYQMYHQLFDGYTSDEIAEWFINNGYWSDEIALDTAAGRVRACNSRRKAQYWKVSELVAWSQHTGRRVLADYVCDHINLQRPTPIGAPGRLQRIHRELDELEHRRVELLREASELTPSDPTDTDADEVPASVTQARFRRGA